MSTVVHTNQKKVTPGAGVMGGYKPVWVLRTEPLSSGSAVSALNN